MDYNQIEEENRRDREHAKHESCKAELRRLCEFIQAGQVTAANVMTSQIMIKEGWYPDE